METGNAGARTELARRLTLGDSMAIVVGMMGKLSKMANGKMQTHAAGSEVNMELLASLAQELGARQENKQNT